jgi:hypothetical protein
VKPCTASFFRNSSLAFSIFIKPPVTKSQALV